MHVRPSAPDPRASLSERQEEGAGGQHCPSRLLVLSVLAQDLGSHAATKLHCENLTCAFPARLIISTALTVLAQNKAMIQPWWAVGLAVPGLIVKGLVGGRNKGKKEDARTFRCTQRLWCNASYMRIFTKLACGACGELQCPEESCWRRHLLRHSQAPTKPCCC